MDKGKAGRRRSSSEIVTQGKRKKSSSSELHKLERSLRNKGLSVDHKSEKGVRGRPVTSKTSLERSTQPSKTVDKNYTKRATYTKEKRRGDDGISLVVSDTQAEDLNSGSRGCDHLEEGSRSKDGTYSDPKMEPTFISRKRKKRLRSNLPDSHNSTSLYMSTEQTKEHENDLTVSSAFEESSEKHYQDPKLLEEITPEPIESDFTKPSSLNSEELSLSATPKSTSDCSVTGTSESSVSAATLRDSNLDEKDKNKLNTIEKHVLSELSEGNQSLIAAEPIVLSSDEEGPIEHKSSDVLKLQSKLDHAMTNEDESIPESALSQVPVDTCELEQASSELCPVTENISCVLPNNEMDLQLNFIFTSVYIGKIKGASKGCVTITSKFVKIPFQVSLNEVLLLVDTTHLKRFGLWKSKDDDPSKRSHAILFLWVSSQYLQEIQTQLENFMLSQQSRSSEFIFLELHNPISQEEELKLKDIMTKISATNEEVELSYPLSWVQALPLFQNLSSKESSFIHYYCASTCSFPAAATEEMKKKSISQPSNIDAAKPTYTFLQKQSSGCYSLSITSNPDEEWQEVRHSGPIKTLIVYPPPPTKGGLGVTNEDLECLEEGEFLNDVIIDFYLKYLILEKASDELVERSHIFSSFFYKCLTRKENNLTEDNPNLSMAQKRHKRVRRWTRHINIFNKDYIFVPVNESSHWYLAVICFPWLEEVVYEDFPQTISQQSQAQQSQHNKTIDNDLCATSALPTGTVNSQSTEMNMSIPKKVCKRPCILILDSLKAASIQNTAQNLREYLEVEWEVKRKTHREFSKTNMVDLCPKVLKQDNSSDCGVYLLQYVESFFKDPIVNFELPIHLEKWFPRHVIKTKREDIRELILKLHLQQQKGSSS
ncbi:sentrin-specific protease 7 isoform X5 [Saccopteryx leptura]|uniref:sentrin-specific protease 7 isoform X5 n=1 Tax=Saccopteryx leptura TaxID=249018 RepID=UPI00339C17A3